jgi:PEP-CTERM motif
VHKTAYKVVLLAAVTVSAALATVVTGTVTLDGKTLHYQAFNGTSASDSAQFLTGATLVDFENISGITPLAVNAYTSGTPTTAANLTDPTKSVNGAFLSAGGQTPGNPANGGTPAALIDVSSLSGAHSGSNVLAPTAQGDPTSPLDFNGFISINFPGDQPISRFGWWTNPQGGNVAFPPHMNTFDASNMLVDLSTGISFTASPGEFVAFAFDSSVVKEVELFQGGPMTVDDFTFARDNKLPFGNPSSVPEPSSAYLLLAAAGVGLSVVRKAILK